MAAAGATPAALAAPAAPAAPAAGKAVPALYATRAEAEKAAKLHFHCSGAHKMGNQWMPCDSHDGTGGPHHGGSHP